METFKNNGKNSSENIVKLKLKQNIKHLLYFQLIHIFEEETDFWQLYDKSANKTENSLWHSYTINGHNGVSLAYFDFNSYLVITGSMHEKKVRSAQSWNNGNHVICRDDIWD